MRILLLRSLVTLIIGGITAEICAQDIAPASVSSSKSQIDSIMAAKVALTPPAPASEPDRAAFNLDTAAVSTALGTMGQCGVYRVSVARSERIVDHDMEIPPSMGVAAAIDFQPTGSGRRQWLATS